MLKAEIGAILRLAIGNGLIEGRQTRRLDDSTFRIRFGLSAVEGELKLIRKSLIPHTDGVLASDSYPGATRVERFVVLR